MKIETKFNRGDKLVAIDTNKMNVVEFTVGAIQVGDYDFGISVTYLSEEKDEKGVSKYVYTEDKCYTSKDELINLLGLK